VTRSGNRLAKGHPEVSGKEGVSTEGDAEKQNTRRKTELTFFCKKHSPGGYREDSGNTASPSMPGEECCGVGGATSLGGGGGGREGREPLGLPFEKGA